jgi:glycosyltransferase involved in cell wall biosynthesis
VIRVAFAGAGAVAEARARARDGARILAWSDEAERELAAAGVPCEPRGRVLGLEDVEAADDAAIAWTRRFGSAPLLDGRPLRDLLRWRGGSLWWFAELYLHHSTPSPRRVRQVELFDRALARLDPDTVEALGLDGGDALLLGRVCRQRGVRGPAPESQDARDRARREVARVLRESRLDALKLLASAVKSRLLPRPATPPRDRPVALFLSHAAFWRERPSPRAGEPRLYEHYFDRLIPELAAGEHLRPWVVAVGPRAPFRRRGIRERLREWMSLARDESFVHLQRYLDHETVAAVLEAGATCRALWERLRRSPALDQAFSHRGVPFADLAEPDLAATLLLQLPWAVRSREEVAAALRSVRPQVACLYAESSGWGRAALAACKAARVPSLGVQHGILYPRYYSYMHGPEDGDCPRPDRTAVFGEAARRFLIEQGRYAPESVVVTGSPKFDELVEAARRWDRAALRAELGIGPAERLVLVASRFRGIRETHQSIGSAFGALVGACEALPAVRLLVKPHPAERAEAYAQVLRERSARGARLLAPASDLARLLFACDVLVTVESLSAVEALVLERPVVVLNMPTNLREIVEAGVALGVPAGDDPLPALRAVLEDAEARRRLSEARERYLDDVARGVDGRATERILGLLRGACATPAGEGSRTGPA